MEDNRDKQNTNSASSTTPENNAQCKDQPINRYSVQAHKKREKPLYYKSLESVLKLFLAIGIVVLMIAVFAIFINLFSIIYARIITTVVSVSSVIFTVAVKIIGKDKEISEGVKDLADLLFLIVKLIKKKCNKSYFVKGICIIIAVPFCISLVISHSSKLRVAAVSEVNEGWDNVINWFESLPSEEESFEKEDELSYPLEMSFIIENYDYSNKITRELVSEAYFFSQDNLVEYLKSIYNSKEPIEKISEYYEAQNAFDSFSNDVASGEAYKVLYGQDEEWYSKLPNEEELHSVINKQKEKAELYPSYLIFERLSNNYQKLALEYHHQNANKDTIKYFYLMSIKNDIKSIEYSTKSKELYASIHRIITRYNDILLCCNYDEEEELYLKTLINSF